MPDKLSKAQFAELVRSMPEASDDDILTAAKNLYNKAKEPLTNIPSKAAHALTDMLPETEHEAPMTTASRKAINFIGDTASEMTSPLNLALTLLGVKAPRLAAIPLVAEGGADAVQGVKERSAGKIGAGLAEAGLGLAGMKKPRVASASTSVPTIERPAAQAAMLSPEELANKVAALHNEMGGSTFNFKGQVSDLPVFSVSTFPGRELPIASKTVTPELIRDYISKNMDVLGQDGTSVGTWFNPEDGKTYIDVSRTVPTLEEALKLGREHNQLAIYDHANHKVIDVPKQ